MLSRLGFAKMIERERWDEPVEPYEVAVPILDGQPLFRLVGARYPGVAMSVVQGTQHLLGEPVYIEDGLTVLLDGSCTVAGCCGVMAEVTVTASRVIWSDFFGRGRPELPEGLRFEFEREQYESALAELPDVPEFRA